MSQTEDKWDLLAQQEAYTLVKLLESPTRKVMVMVVAAQDDEQGTVSLLHAVSSGTKGSHLRQFIVAFEKKLKWLRDKLHRRA